MSIGAGDFGFVRDLVRKRSAIILEEGKEYLVESRLATLARSEGFGSVEQLIADLRTRPLDGLHRKVVEAMTTNETTFFRDAYPFEALQATILPELVRRNGAKRRLTIWSAACSTGQEPYTIAMLIREHFPALLGWNLSILGTDICTSALERAAAGRYTQIEVNRGLPVTYLVKYFTKRDLQWQISDDVRRMVEYRELNLIDPWAGLASVDVVFLRNVLIYFDTQTKKTILGRVRQILHPEGYLFMGGAETTLNLDEAYDRVTMGRAVVHRLFQGRAA
jgi:chemotaxis protein methyltransferase CheR